MMLKLCSEHIKWTQEELSGTFGTCRLRPLQYLQLQLVSHFYSDIRICAAGGCEHHCVSTLPQLAKSTNPVFELIGPEFQESLRGLRSCRSHEIFGFLKTKTLERVLDRHASISCSKICMQCDDLYRVALPSTSTPHDRMIRQS